MLTQIQKWGDSNAIRLPKSLTDALQVDTNDTLQIDIEGNVLVLRRPAPGSLSELFEGYAGEYKTGEWDTGAPTGREVF